MPRSREDDNIPSVWQMTGGTLHHYLGTRLHRLDGPAVTHSDHRPDEWWVHDVLINKGPHPVDGFQHLADLYELDPHQTSRAAIMYLAGILGKNLEAICRLHRLAIHDPGLVPLARAAYQHSDELDDIIDAVQAARE
jgi:hypothetical protein